VVRIGQLRRECRAVTGTPGAQHLVGFIGRVLQILQRQLEKPRLVLCRQVFELPQLFVQRLKACGRAAVLLGPGHELFLDAGLRVVAQFQIHEIGDRQRRDPGTQHGQLFQWQAKRGRLRGQARKAFRAQGLQH